MKKKVYISSDEWYPHFTFHEPDEFDEGDFVSVTFVDEETLKKWNEISEKYLALQSELRDREENGEVIQHHEPQI